MPASAAPPRGLLAAYREIRRVEPPEAPHPGVVVRDPAGSSAVLVDAAALEEWPLWCASDQGHLLAPLDLALRDDGTDVILPVCREKLSAFLGRRSGGAGLGDGERVTVGVSMLRGVGECHELGLASLEGEWWLTETGRPVFAAGRGESIGSSTARALMELGDAAPPALAGALRACADIAGQARLGPADLDRCEHSLFELAAPQSLDLTALAPARARTIAVTATTDAPAAVSSTWHDLLRRHVDTEWGEVVGETTTAVWRRLTRPRGSGRVRPWVIAGLLAAVVLAAGLLWPQPSASEAAPGPSVPTPTTPAPATSAVASDPAPAAPASTASLTDAAATLLDAVAACDPASGCLSDLTEDATTLDLGLLPDVDGSRRSIDLVDDFGGAAVLRVADSRGDEPSALVVIVAAPTGWVLRDVYGDTPPP